MDVASTVDFRIYGFKMGWIDASFYAAFVIHI